MMVAVDLKHFIPKSLILYWMDAYALEVKLDPVVYVYEW